MRYNRIAERIAFSKKMMSLLGKGNLLIFKFSLYLFYKDDISPRKRNLANPQVSIESFL